MNSPSPMVLSKYLVSARLIFLNVLLFALCPLFLFGQVHFVENQGQWDGSFRYRATIPGGTLFIQDTSFTYCFVDFNKVEQIHHLQAADSKVKHHVVSVNFPGSQSSSSMTEDLPTSFYYNYYYGKNPERWVTGIYGHDKLTMNDFYPGIDMELEAGNAGIKTNFIIQPGANPADIQIQYDGIDDILIKDEELKAYTSLGVMTEAKPVAWQIIQGKKLPVSLHWKLNGKTASFQLAEGYNPDFPLVIDPQLIFSTYSGSRADNFGYTATFDHDGNAYSGGTVFAEGFPDTVGAFEADFQGGANVSGAVGDIPRDAGILKYSPDGTQLLFATYLGGSSNEDPHSMVTDANNELIVFGNTKSADFPVRPNAYDTSHNGGSDIYVVKFAEDGKTLLGGTFIGGSGDDGKNGDYKGTSPSPYENMVKLGYNYGDVFRGEVVVDADGFIYVATSTRSNDFPATQGAYQKSFGGGMQDGCAMKFSSDLVSLSWATYLGGTENDACYGIVLDDNKRPYVCGGTESPYFFPDTAAYQAQFQGGRSDAFICHLTQDGAAIIDATYLGTPTYDQAYFVQVDNANNVYVTGQTNNTNFPVKNTNYIDSASGQFITKFDPTLDAIIYSSVFGKGGGIPILSPSAFLVDRCQRVYFSGWGGGPNNFTGNPVVNVRDLQTTDNALQKTSSDGADFYLVVFARNMEKMLYASYFGSPSSDDHVDGGTSRFDRNAIVYQSVCAGCGGFSDFPTTAGAWSRTNNGVRPDNPSQGGCNNALFKIDLGIPTPDFTWKPGPCNYELIFEDLSGSDDDRFWIFPDGSTSDEDNPAYRFPGPGSYPVTLIIYKGTECEDTVTLNVPVDETNPNPIFKWTLGQCAYEYVFEDLSGAAGEKSWIFPDGSTSDEERPTYDFPRPGSYPVSLIIYKGTDCEDTITLDVIIEQYPYDEIFIPNVFTPNPGDELNRYFTVKGIDYNCENIHLTIYNRWGEKVYEIENQPPKWDGTFKGNPLPASAYYYLLENDRIGSVYGSITLIR